MNPKSMTQIATGEPADRPVPQTAASRMPVAAWAAATRSGYGFWSTNPSGSTDWRPASRSANVPVVEEQLEPGRGRQPEVVAARRADAQRLVELLVEQHLLAGRALRPEVRRVDVAAGAERRQLDRHQTGLVRATGAARRGPSGRPRAGSSRQATKAAPGERQRGRRQRAADEQRPRRAGASPGRVVQAGRARGRRRRGSPATGQRHDRAPPHRPPPGSAHPRGDRRRGGPRARSSNRNDGMDAGQVAASRRRSGGSRRSRSRGVGPAVGAARVGGQQRSR